MNNDAVYCAGGNTDILVPVFIGGSGGGKGTEAFKTCLGLFLRDLRLNLRSGSRNRFPVLPGLHRINNILHELVPVDKTALLCPGENKFVRTFIIGRNGAVPWLHVPLICAQIHLLPDGFLHTAHLDCIISWFLPGIYLIQHSVHTEGHQIRKLLFIVFIADLHPPVDIL